MEEYVKRTWSKTRIQDVGRTLLEISLVVGLVMLLGAGAFVILAADSAGTAGPAAVMPRVR